MDSIIRFNPALLGQHFDDHGAEFGAADEEEYERRAIEFLISPLNGIPVRCNACQNCNCQAYGTVHQCRNGDDIIRFDTYTNTIAVMDVGRYIRTYHRLTHGYRGRQKAPIKVYHDRCEIK